MCPSASAAASLSYSALSHFWFAIDNFWRDSSIWSSIKLCRRVKHQLYRLSSKVAVIHKLIKSYCPFFLRFWLNCGLRSITFGGMQHCHSNLTLIKHYKIQAKFEFGGNSPIFDWVLALFWLGFRLMQKLFGFFVEYTSHFSKTTISYNFSQ